MQDTVFSDLRDKNGIEKNGIEYGAEIGVEQCLCMVLEGLIVRRFLFKYSRERKSYKIWRTNMEKGTGLEISIKYRN